jgi:hypothetical protein
MKKEAVFITSVSKHSKYGGYYTGRIVSKELRDFIGKRVRVKITLMKEVEA